MLVLLVLFMALFYLYIGHFHNFGIVFFVVFLLGFGSCLFISYFVALSCLFVFFLWPWFVLVYWFSPHGFVLLVC